jgi:Fur family zinc uptake transcriptional regulator
MPRSLAATPDHDHATCRRSALATAEQVCAALGLALTPVRREVLDIVWTTHQPLGAYEILARLPRRGRAPAPMTVYRALDFLVGAGLVHRLDSINAFVGCPQASLDHAAQLLVCRTCQQVQEVVDPDMASALQHLGKAYGFQADKPQEITGLCAGCQQGAVQPARPALSPRARRRAR